MRARLLPPFRKIHRWIGLLVAIPLLIEGVTGSWLVAAEALDDWRAPSLAAPATHADAAAIVAAASREAGDTLVPAHYAAPEGRAPAMVEFAQRGARGSALRLWIDPTDLTVLARQSGSDDVTRWVHEFHENLFVPYGRSIVGWSGVGMIFMSISGLLLWWPMHGRWRAAFTVSRRARGVRLMRELHGAVAIWLIVPLLFQGVSGIPLGFPAAARELAGLAPMRGMFGRPSGPAQPLNVAAVLARAETALPGAQLIDLRLPTAPGRPVFARFRRLDAWDGAPRPFATIAADGSRVMSVEDPARATATWLIGWNRTLHGMEAGGWFWHVLQFLSGLAFPLLAVTGALLWGVRRLRRARQIRAAQAAE